MEPHNINHIIAMLGLICEKLDIPLEKITAALEAVEELDAEMVDAPKGRA